MTTKFKCKVRNTESGDIFYMCAEAASAADAEENVMERLKQPLGRIVNFEPVPANPGEFEIVATVEVGESVIAPTMAG